MYIDTHCHLNLKDFEDDWLEVAQEAIKAGVEKMIVPGSALESSGRAIEIAEQMENIWASVGFHPHHCKGLEDVEETITELRKLVKHKKVVAIGECGLDYHVYQKSKYSKTRISEEQKKLQKQVFGKQIQLAKEFDLPMIIHNREAQKEILDVIDHFCIADGHYPKGVFHCISGSVGYLQKVLEKGFYIGVDGNVTFSSEVQALAREVPLDRMLLETDSPWLIPEPLRSGLKDNIQERTLHLRCGLRNRPINVKIVAEFVAKLKNVSVDKVVSGTSRNAQKLFNI